MLSKNLRRAGWFHCCLVTQSCLTLRDPMNCSTPGFPVLHYLPEFAQTHAIESVIPSNHLIFCNPLLLLPSIFPFSGSFPMSWLFASGGQSIGASASTSVLPMNIQGWFPLGLTGLISYRSDYRCGTTKYRAIRREASVCLHAPVRALKGKSHLPVCSKGIEQ